MTLANHMEKPDAVSILQTKNFDDGYIGEWTFSDYLRHIKTRFPFLLPLIDEERVCGASFQNYIASMNDISWEFEDQGDGGRGNAYNLAQRNPTNRIVGTTKLLRLFSEDFSEIPGEEKIILDALAGDGTITRLLQKTHTRRPTIISSDLSGFMVKACLKQNFPCIRQSATKSLMKNSVLDGVLIAYGTHHLDSSARGLAVVEAFRTIKVGGRLVLHDFEIGTPSADWFDKVVHPFSRTGHAHKHFSREEMEVLFKNAGFRNVDVFCMDDPFVLSGNTKEEARSNALMHLYQMYDLVRIGAAGPETFGRLEKFVEDILGGIYLEENGSEWTATICRKALVAVGTKVI